MTSSRLAGTALFLLLCVVSSLHAQDTAWTVRCWDGESRSIISIPGCDLVSVTPDSLYLKTQGEVRGIKLYLLSELSRPNRHVSYGKATLTGAAIGLAAGVVASLLIDDSGGGNNATPADSKMLVVSLFGAVGAGLGLGSAIDSRTISYRFSSETNPEKMVVIQGILDQQMEGK